MKKWIIWALLTVAIIIFYQVHYGLATLLPGNINWLMSARHDWGTHYLAWAFYKSEPWHFPLGRIDAYNYPLGTNVGFADSIPLMAMFFKLFRHLLPADFQYLGFWLFSCQLLVAYFTVLLLRRFKVSWFIAFIGALFMATNPVLLYRAMHPALSAHWLLLACVYVYVLDPSVTGTRRILSYQLILLALSALINPYLCWMVLGFTLITPVKLSFFDKKLSLRNFFLYMGLSLFTLLLLYYLVGFIQFQKKEELGVGGAYGLYGMNLNSLWNPGGYSSFLPQMPWVSWHQYEGFMYLGVGVFLLLLILLCRYIFTTIQDVTNRKRSGENTTSPKKKLKNRNLILLLALAVIYAILAITLVFTYNDKVLFKLPAPGFFITLEEIFRASGRFFWLPYYLIILLAIIGIARIKANPVIPAAIVALAFIVQAFDIKMMLIDKNLPRGTYTPPMEDQTWINLMRQFDEVLFLPPFQSPGIRPMDYQDFSYLALKAGKPINCAYVPRADYHGMQVYSDSLTDAVAQGKLSPKAIYITSVAALEQFSFPVKKDVASLHSLDGCYFLISKAINDPLLDTLTKRIDAEHKVLLDSAMIASGRKKQFTPFPRTLSVAPGALSHNLEAVTLGPDYLSIHGWVVRDSTKDNTGDSVFFTLDAGGRSYFAAAGTGDRQDVAAAFPEVHVVNAGVALIAFTDSLPKGSYQLGIIVKTAQGRYIHMQTEREVRVDISDYAAPVKLTTLPPEAKIIFDLHVDDEPTEFSMDGWAALPDRDATTSTIQLILKSSDSTFAFDVKPTVRKDVTDYFKNKYQLDNSGYRARISKIGLPAGRYRIGFLIRDAKRHDAYMKLTDREVSK